MIELSNNVKAFIERYYSNLSTNDWILVQKGHYIEIAQAIKKYYGSIQYISNIGMSLMANNHTDITFTTQTKSNTNKELKSQDKQYATGVISLLLEHYAQFCRPIYPLIPVNIHSSEYDNKIESLSGRVFKKDSVKRERQVVKPIEFTIPSSRTYINVRDNISHNVLMMTFDW